MSTSEASEFAENNQKLELSKRKIEKEIAELKQSNSGFEVKISELQTELGERLHMLEERIRALLGANISILAK